MKTYKIRVNEELRNNPKKHELTSKELKHLQEVLFNIFIDFKTVCEKYNLTYMLIGGSCLGAVRHQGFIPWDDDFDIAISRKDFEEFKKVFQMEMGSKYVLDCPNYSTDASNRFPKLLLKNTKFVEIGAPEDNRSCIKIDFFIIENIPDGYFRRIIKGLRCTSVMFIAGHVQSYEEYARDTDVKRKISKRELVGKFFSFKNSSHWFDYYDRIVRYNHKSKLLGIPSGRKHYFRETLSGDVFFPVSEGFFVDMKVNLPNKPDVYLSNLYGDYMKIPPLEKREKHYLQKIVFPGEMKE